MSLASELSKVGEEEFQNDLTKEVTTKEYMPSAAFPDCLSRAKAMMYNGVTRMEKIYALAIVTHRERDHGEDHGKEREELISTMETADIMLAESRSFWRN